MRPLLVLIAVLAAAAAVLVALFATGPDEPVELTPTPEAQHEGSRARVQLVTDEAPVEVVRDTEVTEEGAEEPERTVGGYQNSLSGTVYDAQNRPLARAKVELCVDARTGEYLAEKAFSGEETAFEPPVATTQTDEQGRYSFYSVEPKADYFVAASHPDYMLAQEYPISIGEEGSYRGPEFFLTEGSVLNGYVTDANGGPLMGAEVHTDSAYVMVMDHRSPDRMSATTDATGYFEIRNVPGGARNVTAEAEGHGQQIRHNIMFEGEPGTERTIEFALEPSQQIGGLVLGPDGLGVPQAEVWALHYGNTTSSRGRALTDEKGEFLIDGLATGSYMMRVTAPGFRQTSSRGGRAQAGDLNVELSMVPQARVSGQVVDNATGQPIERFQCVVQSSDETGAVFESTGVKGAFNDPGGAFELVGLDPGTYVVLAKAAGYAPSNSKPFTVTATHTTLSGVAVRLSKGASLVGRVLDPEGQPVRGARVETFDNDHVDNLFNSMLANLLSGNATKRKARTDAEGNFELELLTPEIYQVHVVHPDYTKTVLRDLDVNEGQVRTIPTITLKVGGTIRGTLRDAAGNVLARGQVVLQSEDGITTYQGRTDTAGRYEFRHVSPGAYKLSATRVAPGSGKDVFTAIVDQKNSEVAINVFDGSEVTRDLTLGG